jgi:hypothetical protein
VKWGWEMQAWYAIGRWFNAITGWAVGLLSIVVLPPLVKFSGHEIEFSVVFFAIWLSFWAFKKLRITAYLVPTLAVTTAHEICVFLGALLAAHLGYIELFLLGLLEIIAIAVLVLWVSKRPSLISLTSLLIYQSAAIVITMYNASHFRMSGVIIVMHLGMRSFEIGASIYALYKLRKLNVSSAQSQPSSHKSMAEYYYIINNAVSKLGSNTHTTRQTLYDLARGTLATQLGQDRPRLAREQHTLEAAIREVEDSFMMREERTAPALALPSQ